MSSNRGDMTSVRCLQLLLLTCCTVWASKHYSFQIDREVIRLSESEILKSGTMTLMTLRGKRYACRQQESSDDLENNGTTAAQSNATIDELLEPMQPVETAVRETTSDPATSKCLIQDQGWWKFEFCFNKFIRQFHAVADPKTQSAKIEQMHYLGKADEAHSKTASTAPKVVGSRMRSYFSQEYTDGADCDLTGQPRRTTVYFVCAAEMPAGKRVLKVNERSSCVYDAVVESSLPCAHPLFEAERQSAEKQRIAQRLTPIKCSLVDAQLPPKFMAKWQKHEPEPTASVGELVAADGSPSKASSRPPVKQLKVTGCHPGGTCALSITELSPNGRLKSLQPGLGFHVERAAGALLLGGWGSEHTEFGLSLFHVMTNKSLVGVYTVAQSGGRTGREEATPVGNQGAGLEGLYHLRGSQPADDALPGASGWHYDGMLELKASKATSEGTPAQSFRCKWVVGEMTYSGIGMLSEDAERLVVGWGTESISLVEYQLLSKSELVARVSSYNMSAVHEWDGSAVKQLWELVE